MDENTIAGMPERTPDMIAAEIALIKEQTGKILLVSAVEIGRRLTEAKQKIPFGQFVAWLEDAVQYSESTAYRLMRIAEEYGPQLSRAAGAETETQTEPLARLGYTQALILLGLPAEERAEFITQFDLENTAVRELQQAVKDRNKALAEKEALQKECDTQKSSVSKLSNELNRANKDASDKLHALWAEQGKVTELQRKLDTIGDENAAARRIARVERESEVAKINLSMAQADARFDLIAKGFEDLFSAIKEMAASDPTAFRFYLQQINEFIAKTSKRLRRMENANG